MRSLGIVRNLDQLGRLVSPKETRKAFNLNDGDPVEIFTDGDEIILKKYNPGCHCCGSFDGSHQRICPFCHTVYDMKEEGWVITKIGE